jgi:hypothetical protein
LSVRNELCDQGVGMMHDPVGRSSPTNGINVCIVAIGHDARVLHVPRQHVRISKPKLLRLRRRPSIKGIAHEPMNGNDAAKCEQMKIPKHIARTTTYSTVGFSPLYTSVRALCIAMADSWGMKEVNAQTRMLSSSIDISCACCLVVQACVPCRASLKA